MNKELEVVHNILRGKFWSQYQILNRLTLAHHTVFDSAREITKYLEIMTWINEDDDNIELTKKYIRLFMETFAHGMLKLGDEEELYLHDYETICEFRRNLCQMKFFLKYNHVHRLNGEGDHDDTTPEQDADMKMFDKELEALRQKDWKKNLKDKHD